MSFSEILQVIQVIMLGLIIIQLSNIYRGLGLVAELVRALGELIAGYIKVKASKDALDDFTNIMAKLSGVVNKAQAKKEEKTNG